MVYNTINTRTIQTYLMKQLYITNPSGEELNVHVYENKLSKSVILFVHGWGVGKYDGLGLFRDWVSSLNQNHACVLFDFSGVHESQGKSEDISFSKEISDLETMLDWVQSTYPESEINIIAHSRGCQIVSKLNPDNISNIVFSGIPNWNADYIIRQISGRISAKNKKPVDFDSITKYPRSDGTISKIGPQFWTDYQDFDMLELTQKLTYKSSLLILHPAQDDVVGHEYIREYNDIDKATFKEIPGDHSYSDPNDRDHALKIISDWLR